MASVQLGRALARAVAYPPLVDTSMPNGGGEFHEALREAKTSKDLAVK